MSTAAQRQPPVRYVLVDLAFTLMVIAGILVVLSRLVPAGVTQVFAERAWPRLLALAIVVLAWPLLRHGWSAIKPRRGATGVCFRSGDAILLLLPLTPVIQYIFLNLDILSLADAVVVLVIFLALSTALILVVPGLLATYVSRPMLMAAGIALAFLLTAMASLSWEFTWHRRGSLNIQFAVFFATFIACAVFYRLRKELLYVVIVAFFLLGVLNAAFTEPNSPDAVRGALLSDLTSNNRFKSTPDIYLLTYDAYVSNETMTQYGIDNSAQENYLDSLGFKLYTEVYSLGPNTAETMSLVLGLGNAARERALSGDADVPRVLKMQGYETHGVFSFNRFFRQHGSNYDHGFPPAVATERLLLLSILEGEFRFDIDLETMDREEFVETKRVVMKSRESKPRFLYTHVFSPGHTQSSGACLHNETQLFERRLRLANAEMKEDIEAILANGREAIIIVNGDHGPYLTKNCYKLDEQDYDPGDVDRLDIQDRFGTFLAIRWPDERYTNYDDIVVLQDIFPAVLAYLLEDPRVLEARIGTSISEDFRSRFTAGVGVEQGIVVGGASDGRPLFDSLHEPGSGTR